MAQKRINHMHISMKVLKICSGQKAIKSDEKEEKNPKRRQLRWWRIVVAGNNNTNGPRTN